ncbi:unnamed protein product [Mytilus coruscus]|uniref:Uncharacterized protein n=1 Tax=Mytilus coruscus TaxID=42192 RepID=A0A6J8DVC0_MYTCO|nr:unnamed protein product [Mytilus coruscus]
MRYMNCVSLNEVAIKYICNALDLQKYPDGVTAIYAQAKCGRSGLENDPSVLTKISKLHGQEFWTGVGIYTQFTPWIEILEYNGTIKTSEEENELCATLKCTFNHDEVMVANLCKGNPNIQGLCEDGMPSTSGAFWNLPQNQTFENCWNKDKLVLHSNACKHFAPNLTSFAWINVFREEIEVERIIDSTTVKNTYQTNEATESNYGVIVGGSVGAVIVLLIVVTVILCKLRRVGFFKNNTSTETTNVVFTQSVNDEETSVEVKTQQHVNQGYGLVNQAKEKDNNFYAQVQKVKHMEDTYTESSNGEYDHLHSIAGRKPYASENTYDSNAGVRNRYDPTYDSATSSTRVDMDNTYDHSTTNMKTYSEYDVSDTSMQIARTNYDPYDQAR